MKTKWYDWRNLLASLVVAAGVCIAAALVLYSIFAAMMWFESPIGGLVAIFAWVFIGIFISLVADNDEEDKQ